MPGILMNQLIQSQSCSRSQTKEESLDTQNKSESGRLDPLFILFKLRTNKVYYFLYHTPNYSVNLGTKTI